MKRDFVTDELHAYYSARADEYEEIYHQNDPVKLAEQNAISKKIHETFSGRNVLEVACGTGYWTTGLSETAKAVVAIDYADEVLKIAQSKRYECPVQFQKYDAYNLKFSDNSFDGALVNHWISHVPTIKIRIFLQGLYRVLSEGAKVFVADDVRTKDILVYPSEDHDTYAIRTLNNGAKYKVLKNYYTPAEIKNLFGEQATNLNFQWGERFWYVLFDLKKL